jgi:DNA-binding transcriptional MerR regulator
MNIKQFAKITGLSSHTLRYYEKMSLILDIKRDTNGFRFYSENDLAWIDFLKKLKATGMPLIDMKTFAQLRRAGETEPSISARIAILEKHRKKIQADVIEIENFLAKVKEKIKFYQKKVVSQFEK